jgi:hypothetical protein
MVYAASTKGTTALWTELLTVARILGLEEVLRAEVEESPVYVRTKNSIPSMPNRSRRWVGEMEEIAKTFEPCGLTPLTFEGAAAIYAFVADSPPGRMAPEDWRDQAGSFEDLVATLARSR